MGHRTHLTLHRRPSPAPLRQRGNALILALLALAITGLTVITALQNRRLEIKRETGAAEAGVLERLRNGVQAAIHEHLPAIQQGHAITRNGVTVTPEAVEGELVWAPSIDQLRDMGYLPEGWHTTRSALNEGPYGITFRRVPAGCAAPTCDVDGLVSIRAPILDGAPGAPVDGAIIGPILTRSGVDGGVSLPTAPAMIHGFNGTWRHSNPVPGSPAGVVGLRVGTNTGGLSQFVRIGDLRDPNLGGNLSIQGSTTIGTDASVRGSVKVGSNADAPCIGLDPTGAVSVECSGAITAKTGVFADGSGGRSEINAAGIATTGRIESEDGIKSGGNVLFPRADPQALTIQTGELHIRSPDKTLLSLKQGNLQADGVVTSQRLAFSSVVTEGAACEVAADAPTGVQMGLTNDRSTATCIDGRWSVSARVGKAGAACAHPGGFASDSMSGEALICRYGRYIAISSLLSKFVLMDTLAIQITDAPVQVQKPACSAQEQQVERLIILIPNNEAVPTSAPNIVSGINRFATDEGNSWLVHAERSSDGSALPSNLIAGIYCFYA